MVRANRSFCDNKSPPVGDLLDSGKQSSSQHRYELSDKTFVAQLWVQVSVFSRNHGLLCRQCNEKTGSLYPFKGRLLCCHCYRAVVENGE